eukprot:8100469-Karenia_brevis.AAC.1
MVKESKKVRSARIAQQADEWISQGRVVPRVEHAAAKKEVPGEVLQKGLLLGHLVEDFLHDAEEMDINSPILDGVGHLDQTFCTLCSGSEVAAVAVRKLEQSLQMRGVTLNCRQKYGCEIKDDKRKFGMGV